jgi:hypothetical protein
MALKKTISLKNNFDEMSVFSDAYIKVVTIAGDKNEMHAFYGVFKDASSRCIEKVKFQFIPSLDGKNFIAQAYAHLKTLPEFAGAIDC